MVNPDTHLDYETAGIRKVSFLELEYAVILRHKSLPMIMSTYSFPYRKSRFHTSVQSPDTISRITAGLPVRNRSISTCTEELAH